MALKRTITKMVVGRTTMKIAFVLLLSLLFSASLLAQDSVKDDKGASLNSKTVADSIAVKQAAPIPKTPADTVAAEKVAPIPKAGADSTATQARIETHSEAGLNTKWYSLRDSIFYTKYNKYGDLKDDDPVYNPKRPWWHVGLKIMAASAFTNTYDLHILKGDYAKISIHTWAHNIKTGWEWDTDRFGMNFFFHPYAGGGYYNSALSSGYNYYQAFPFAFAGSLIWEYFGENTLPSYNDQINTPISGAYLGEVLYRVSSNILDDRATGMSRFWRELAAAAVDPTRGFGRLVSGKLWRHTSREIYQKEPLNITLSTGERRLNNGHSFGTGTNSATFNVHLDYGNPFEVRSRKPFDYFKFRADFNFGVGRKTLDNMTGSGIIFGNNYQIGSMEVLAGVFQHYDYWDNNTFELGTMAFGAGVVTKLPVTKNSQFYTTIHLNIVPLAGNSTQYGPDTSQFRDYNYGGGLGGKIENTLELGKRASATFIGYYYWIHTYVGHKGDHYLGLIRPRFELRMIRNLSLGFEHLVYYSDRYPTDFPSIHKVRTEQRVYLKMYFEQFKRKE
jgi:hypothetical protein